MNKFLKLLYENENKIKVLLIIYAFYCSIVIGISWDERYYHKIGEINLKYLLSFGLVDEGFNLKYRYSTLYWSLSSLLSQILPDKFSIEVHHIINTFFGLMVFVGVYQVIKKMFNKEIAKTTSYFLFFLPLFFGHLAINNKDIIIAFAHVWTIYYLIKYTIKEYSFQGRLLILIKISVLTALGTGIQLLFLGSLIPIVIIFLLNLIILKIKKFSEIFLDFIIFLILFYCILILFWVDTHQNIFVLPFKFFIDTLSLEVGWPFNLTNGEYTFSNDVPTRYLLINYLFKLPEYIIFLYVLAFPIIFFKYKKLKELFSNFSNKLLIIIALILFPNLILIFITYSIYDGVRLFLWAVPYLVIIPAITFYCIKDDQRLIFIGIKIILIILFSFHVLNFVKITPFHYTFLNIFNGDVKTRYQKFENDYWSVSLKELILSSNLSEKKINFAVCGVNPLVVKTYMKQKYKNVEYTDINNASYVIMTNRTLYSEKNQSISNCFDEYNYENVVEVKRNGLIISAIKKIK